VLNKKFTTEEVKKYIINNGYVPLFDEYQGRIKITIQDLNGYKMDINFSELKRGSIPRVFEIRNPHTINNIKLWCQLNKKPFELISNEYTGSNEKLQWRCLKENCNETFEKNWSSIQTGQGCPYCNGMQVGISNCLATKRPDLIKQWHPIKNGDLTPYDFTYGSDTKVWWLCDECGHEWESKISNRLRNGCPKHKVEKMIIGKLKPSYDNNLLIVNPKLCEEWDYNKNEKGPEEYYYGSGQRVWWKCKKCNYEWESQISNRNYHGCPKCNSSKGENAIEEYLIDKHIKYQMFFRINECCNIHVLPFDFAIFDDSDNLQKIIEFDGRQHFEPYEFFGGEIDFKKRQLNDSIKTNYCFSNNIPLLRIPYWDFKNIESILDGFLLSKNNQIELQQIM
jgi:hypothetical protein